MRVYPQLSDLPTVDRGQTYLVGPWINPQARERLLADLTREAVEPLRPLGRWLLARRRAELGRALTATETLQALLDGTHRLVEYRHDPSGDTDYYQRATWTLTPRGDTAVSPLTRKRMGSGDCEDEAIVVAAFFLGVGYDGWPKWLPQDGAQNHVYVRVCGLPEGCVPVETTLPGAWIGEPPYEALRRLGGRQRILG